MAEEKRFQSFRKGADGRVVKIEAFYHEESAQYLIEWDDIKDIFLNLDYVLKGDAAVPRAKDPRTRKRIEPPCISYYHEEILEVAIDDLFIAGAEPSSAPATMLRTKTPVIQLDNVLSSTSSPSQTEGTPSSLWTADSVRSNQTTTASALGDSSNLLSPPGAPHHAEHRAMHIDMSLEHQSRHPLRLTMIIEEDKLAIYDRPVIQVTIFINKQTSMGQQTVSTTRQSGATGPFTILAGSVNPSTFPAWSPKTAVGLENRDATREDGTTSMNSIKPPVKSRQRQPAVQNSAKYDSSGFSNNPSVLSAELPSPPLTIRTAVTRTERPDSIVRSYELLQQMELRVQSFERLMVQGQLAQAMVVQKQAESIKQEMAQYHESHQSEIAKNTALQLQVRDMMAEAEKMTKRILELQEAQMDNDERILATLALIQSKAAAILIQTYELHEFPIPRLFIILPKEDITKREKISTLFVQRFRLYFLCECGEHTRPVDGPPSTLSHDIHLARHEGYDLDRPNEFFRKYGSYVLALLQMLKYGVAAAGMVVPPLNTLKVADELALAKAGLKAVEKNLAPRVDSAIAYLQGLKTDQEEVSKELGNTKSAATAVDPVFIGRLEGLEGADLRHLGSFLKTSDQGKALGNLYRTVTPQGHVKWVCLDHYRESYGAAALKEFKETVELNGGTYDQRTGRVAMRLTSPILAKHFYTMLLSTRLVHELELTLDWNTAFEDLRTLKGTMQQSNVFYLALDLCGKTGPGSDFVYRNRRAEPIVLIMASGKIHAMILKNSTAFLSQTKDLFKTTTPHIRHFDLNETVSAVDDFVKLEKLILACPALVRLGVVVDNIDSAFARLKPFVARHKALAILDLALRDGTAASMQFEQGTDNISTIGLKLIEPSAIKLVNMPMVTSVVFLAKNTPSQLSDIVQTAIVKHGRLKVIEFLQLPDEVAEILHGLKQAIDEYTCGQKGVAHGNVRSTMSSPLTTNIPESHLSATESRFVALASMHRRSLLYDMGLLVVSTDEPEAAEDPATESEKAPPTDMHKRRSTFTIRRADESLACVRFDFGGNGTNAVIMHVDDFDASEALQQTLPTTLTVIGREGSELFSVLAKDPTSDFSNLHTVELELDPDNLLEILQTVHSTTTTYPTLTRLNVWNTHNSTMRSFCFPLQDLSLLDYYISTERFPSLQNLFHTVATLSTVTLSIPSVFDAFKVVSAAVQLQKQISSVQLFARRSQATIAFGGGQVQSITLRTRDSQLGRLRSLPKVTVVDLDFSLDLSNMKDVALSVFTHYRHIETFRMRCSNVKVLELIDTLNQAALEVFASCRVVLSKTDIDVSRKKDLVLDLPLEELDIRFCSIDGEDLETVERLVRTSLGLQVLYVSVISIESAQRIFDSIYEEKRSMTTLSLSLRHGPTAIFSLKTVEAKHALAVVQKFTMADLNDTFFLPSAKLERVDIVGTQINKSQAAEIATFVLRHHCEVSAFRFMDFSNDIQDIPDTIKSLILHESILKDIGRTDGTHNSSDSAGIKDKDARGAEGVDFAVFEASTSNTQDEASSAQVRTNRISSILRLRPDGSLEMVELDWSDPNGTTLWLNLVAFDKFEFPSLSDVTNLEMSIGTGTTNVINLPCPPVKTFISLKRLKLTCLSSCHSSMLLAVIAASSDHPAMEKISIWHPDNPKRWITYQLPIKALDLAQHTLSSNGYLLLQRIIVTSLSLSEIALTVSSPLTIFNEICSPVGKPGSLKQVNLYGDSAFLHIRFKPETCGMDAVTLALKEVQNSTLRWEVPVLTTMYFSEQTLELIHAIQEAAVDNSGPQTLFLKNWNKDTSIGFHIPFRKFDLSGRIMSTHKVQLLKRLLILCPLLTEVPLTVESIAEPQEATKITGQVYQKLKSRSCFLLSFFDGTEASIRYSDMDGSIDSVALRTSDKFVTELGTMPMIKKLTICPKNTSRWLDEERTILELGKVLELYPNLKTLELDRSLDNPVQVLLYFQDNTHLRPLFRRFRHRLLGSSATLITHDLPFRKLYLRFYSTVKKNCNHLKALLFVNPLITELMIMVSISDDIDLVYNKLSIMSASFKRLNVLVIKANNGFSMSFQRNKFYLSYDDSQEHESQAIESFEIEASGTEWPSAFTRHSVTKLTVLPSSINSTSSGSIDYSKTISSSIWDILSKARTQFVSLNHLVLTCSMDQFFVLRSNVLSHVSVTRFDLQDPVDNRTIISTTISRGHVSGATAFLDKISDRDLIDTFSTAFPESQMRMMISLDQSQHTEIDVSLDCLAKEGGEVLSRITWDTKNVSGHRVFELLETLSSKRKATTQLEFRVIWKPVPKAPSSEAKQTLPWLRPYSDILEYVETVAALVKLLVRRATAFDIEYETMKALIPFMKAEIERGFIVLAGEPFSQLQKYDIRVVSGPAKSEDIVKFDLLIPRQVEHTIHDVTTVYFIPPRN
ncbi:hypothetical protein BGZ47_005015 [Haplosporangium gracile]|nr:hypothetical protein BGZ47_005015 [Haplosporangium gracile]